MTPSLVFLLPLEAMHRAGLSRCTDQAAKMPERKDANRIPLLTLLSVADVSGSLFLIQSV